MPRLRLNVWNNGKCSNEYRVRQFSDAENNVTGLKQLAAANMTPCDWTESLDVMVDYVVIAKTIKIQSFNEQTE